MKIVVIIVALSVLMVLLSAPGNGQASTLGDLAAPGNIEADAVEGGPREAGDARGSVPDASFHRMSGVMHAAVGDYDADDDGLIDVANLEQLNAIRWDLDGDGSSLEASYGAAFPNADAGMGCPASGCVGYELTEDLDFVTTTGAVSWVPIGNLVNSFTATFDGNGHTISNLRITRGGAFSGLFGSVGSGGVIRRVGLVEVDIVGENTVGGLVAHLASGTIADSYVTGSVRGDPVSGFDQSVGGLVGAMFGNNASITRSHTATTVSSNHGSAAGGLVGYVVAGTVADSFATGFVSSGGDVNDAVGGLVGQNFGGTIAGCYAAGDVSGNGFVGGLVGVNSDDGTITSSYATGDASILASTHPELDDAGGLVAHNSGAIVASYATGNVYGNDHASSVGGLVGANVGGVGSAGPGRIAASYATGAVSGSEDAGGLLGFQGDEGVVTSSYWDTQTSGQTESAGGAGKTTRELQSPTGYTGIYADWNVDLDGDGSSDDPWDFGTSSEYPRLKLAPASAGDTTLTKPANVHAVSNAAGELTLTWEGGDNADSYVLIAADVVTFDYETEIVSDGAARTGTVTGLVGGVTYLGIVVALQATADDLETLYGTSSVVRVQSGVAE